MTAAEDYKKWPTLTAMFYEQASRIPDKPYLWQKREGQYHPLTYGEIAKAVQDAARGLRDLGLQKGDRVLLVSENRPEWIIADLAIMSLGAITVPAYTTNTIHDNLHVLTDSAAAAAIVSTGALQKALLPAVEQAPSCRFVISLEPFDEKATGQASYHEWDDVLAKGRSLDGDVEAWARECDRDDVCCFIYTSGTGGSPKGVMLSHGNILANCLGAFDLLEEFGLGDEIFLSFLPLSHSYEHTAGAMFPISIGAQVYFAESVETLLANMAEARPTIMTAVPRLYESIHQRVRLGIKKQPEKTQKIFAMAEELGRRAYEDPDSLSFFDRIKNFVCEFLVRRKFRKRFGGRLKAFVSGGAALNPEIGIFFQALGVRVLQGYGQTEAAPVISCNRPHSIRMHTVGPPVKGVEVKIAPDGEILVRGEMVMKGYWRQEEATAETVQDGWLHTGDVGRIDNHGMIQITDRKKDIVVLSGGDNVSPARVEGILTIEPEIAQAFVSGDKRPHLVGLLVPDSAWMESWAKAQGKSGGLSELHKDPDLKKALTEVVDRVNKKLSNLEKVKRFMIAEDEFSVDNEMMTPTLKIRRHVIKGHYAERLNALYGRG